MTASADLGDNLRVIPHTDGAPLADLRHELWAWSLTYREVARVAGVSESLVSRVLNGKQRSQRVLIIAEGLLAERRRRVQERQR